MRDFSSEVWATFKIMGASLLLFMESDIAICSAIEVFLDAEEVFHPFVGDLLNFV